MITLKKIDSGVYCFLVTFDPSSETANIVDLQTLGAAAAVGGHKESSQDKLESQFQNEPLIQQSRHQTRQAEAPQVQGERTNDTPSKPPVPAAPPDIAVTEPVKVEPPRPRREYRPQDLLSREEASDYLGIAKQTLAMWKCTKRYDVPFVKIGRLVKYRRSDLDSFIDSMTQDPANPPKRKR